MLARIKRNIGKKWCSGTACANPFPEVIRGFLVWLCGISASGSDAKMLWLLKWKKWPHFSNTKLPRAVRNFFDFHKKSDGRFPNFSLTSMVYFVRKVTQVTEFAGIYYLLPQTPDVSLFVLWPHWMGKKSMSLFPKKWHRDVTFVTFSKNTVHFSRILWGVWGLAVADNRAGTDAGCKNFTKRTQKKICVFGSHWFNETFRLCPLGIEGRVRDSLSVAFSNCDFARLCMLRMPWLESFFVRN